MKDEKAASLEAFKRLEEILDTLRRECPWDRKQTMKSLRYLTIEEVHELSEAIVALENEKEDASAISHSPSLISDLKKELGDLAMHILFYCKIAEEQGLFTTADVYNTICDKLIDRHPFIYHKEDYHGESWEQLKMREGRKNVLEGVPDSLPSLVKAIRMQEKVSGTTDNTAEPAGMTEEEFGQKLFDLVDWGRRHGINADDALCAANYRFKKKYNECLNASMLELGSATLWSQCLSIGTTHTQTLKHSNIQTFKQFSVALSPMDDITDLPFRQLCKEFGADMLVTEFIASEALNRDAEKSLRKMRFTPEQRPIGIQIFGADEEELLRCLDVVEQAEPDFIDINWGCPVRKVAGKGAGSGILQDIPKMLRITAAIAKRSHLPVTVKTRLAYSHDTTPITDFAEALQDTGIAALAIHGRTKTQMYSGQADWTMIGQVKNNPRIYIPIFGNGDITTAAQAVAAKERYGVDGILIGRGAIGNPWIFEQCRRALAGLPEREISVAERVEVCRRHLLAAAEFKGERTAVFEMRKHYGAYFKGLYNFKPFRLALVSSPTLADTLAVLDSIGCRY